MRGHNIYFHGEIRKIIFELSSITSLIWSSVGVGISFDFGVSKMFKVFMLKFLCDGQGADRQAILSL